jgi:putative hemolysin
MAAERLPRDPIELPRPKTAWVRSLVDVPFKLAERALGLDQIEAITRAVESGDASVPVAERILQVTGLNPVVATGELERIPAKGAAVVCSNHPYGVADGAVMLALCARRRPDMKLFTNGVLARFPFLADRCIFVDPFGGTDAARRNAAALREAKEWLRAGHVLACFPAGEVSAVHWGAWSPADPPWSTIPARLALGAKAPMVPAWFEGSNRALFHAAGLVHPRLRTALLPNEFLARCGQPIEVRFGRAVSTEGTTMDAEAMTRLVRGRSELLRREPRRAPAQPVLGPIAEQSASDAEIAAEFAALPAAARLFSEGRFDLFATGSDAVPRAMCEIGRLREIAFRAVGEGSGKPFDVDRFDASYVQLILWDREEQRIAGGYRAGVVADVTRGVGIDGLYTSTLFEYSPRLLHELGDAVELGRSFVRLEYQRQPLPLFLLWRGIGAFMLSRGHRRMFGPVSISNDYNSMSKELIMEFLERHRLSAPFAPLVTPRHPPTRRGIASWTQRERAEATADIAHVEKLIEEIERGQRAVPVLLRHYLRLNARLLALNVDPDFGEVIDALMLVDLAQIDDRIIRHYVGDGAIAAIRERFPQGDSARSG